jgi:hypothetical protein
MTTTASSRREASDETARPHGPRRPGRDTLVPIISALTVLAFFVVLHPVLGLRVPIGSDSPVYVWWARFAGAEGLGGLQTGSRPAIVGLLAALSGITHVQTAAVVEVLGPVLAASLAVAAAGLARIAVSQARPRLGFLLSALLSGAFLGYLVPGYLSTLAFLGAFVAMLAVVAAAAGRGGIAAAIGGGLLLSAAGLSHPQFVPLAAGITVGSAIALAPSFRSRRRAGAPFVSTSLGRLAGAWGMGLAGVGLGILAADGGPSGVVDTSRDSVLRRTGLGSLLEQSYRRKLHHDVPWWRALALIALPLTAAPLAWSPPEEGSDGADADPCPGERSALFWGATAAWLLITLAGVGALVVGVAAAPGQRLVVTCLPLPILAGMGLAAIRFRNRLVTWATMLVAAGLFLAALGSVWLSNRPLSSPEQIVQARAAGAALAETAPGTPLLLVVDDLGDKPALFITRYANVLRGAVPAARVPDVAVWVGSPRDVVAAGPGAVPPPTLTGRAEHDRMALDYRRRDLPLLARRPLIVAVRSVDPRGYRLAVSTPDARVVAPGVVALRVPGVAPPGLAKANAPASRLSASLRTPGTAPVSPWLPAWLAPILLAGLAVAGWPWIRLTVPSADRSTILALAPAMGIAALSVAAVLIDAFGIRLADVGAYVALALTLSGWAVWWMRSRLTASASGLTLDSSGSAAADRGQAAAARSRSHRRGRWRPRRAW